MVNEELIVKFLAGEAEDHEVVLLQNWRRADDENEKHFLQLEKLWTSSAGIGDKKEFDTDAAWTRVDARLSAKEKGKQIPLRRVWLAAASVVLLFGFSLIIYQASRKEKFLLGESSGNTKKEIRLSDGSQVVLKNAILAYPESFKGKKRKVELRKGSAYFSVTRNTEQAFEISAGKSTVTVLGTEFELQAENDFTRLRVNSGKVLFACPAGSAVLGAGKTAVYYIRENRLDLKEEDHRNNFSYATGKLDFRNSSLAEVVADLNRYYTDREIVMDASLQNCRLTATFENEKLENVLEIIRLTMDVEIRWDRKTDRYIIEGKDCIP